MVGLQHLGKKYLFNYLKGHERTCQLYLVGKCNFTVFNKQAYTVISIPLVSLLKMKDSLLNLQRGIGLSDYSSEAEEKRSRYH